MTPEELEQIANDIIKEDTDLATRTSLMTQLTSAFVSMYTQHADAIQERDKIQEKNRKLTDTNIELFEKLNKQTLMEMTGGPKEKPEQTELERAETITFEDLFKEDEK